MEKIFRSNDGTIFATEKECLDYESMHDEEFIKKRRDEVEEAHKKYSDLLSKYIRDYGSYERTDSGCYIFKDSAEFMKNIFGI